MKGSLSEIEAAIEAAARHGKKTGDYGPYAKACRALTPYRIALGAVRLSGENSHVLTPRKSDALPTSGGKSDAATNSSKI